MYIYECVKTLEKIIIISMIMQFKSKYQDKSKDAIKILIK